MYAEFTTNASVLQYGCEQAEHHCDSGVPADYILDDPGSRCNLQFDGHLSKLNVYPEKEVHPQYRPEEYVDFLLQR